MIKTELKKIKQLQRYSQNLTSLQIENNLIKQDFYRYSLFHREADPLFQSEKQPQDRILALIQDHDIGTYQQLQQLEYRMNYMMSLDWNYNRGTQLKSKYLRQRKYIVDSGITIREVIPADIFSSIDPLAKDPYSTFIRSYYQTRYVKNQFLWQFFDRFFELFEKYPIQNQEQAQQSKQIEDLTEQQCKKIKDIKDLFHKLSLLISIDNIEPIQIEQQQ